MARAITCARFFRFLRSIFVPATTILAFSCLLTFFFVLYQPTRGPGDLQRLGWQAWDTITLPVGGTPSTSESVDGTVVSGGDDTGGEDGDTTGGADWWNVSRPTDSTTESASLPLDVWSPLLPHDTGCVFLRSTLSLSLLTNDIPVSEITVVRCMWDTRFVDMCSPSASAEDAIKGKWVRVERDLNRQTGMWHLVSKLGCVSISRPYICPSLSTTVVHDD